MSNKINDLIYSIHKGLSVAEHQGDVRIATGGEGADEQLQGS